MNEKNELNWKAPTLIVSLVILLWSLTWVFLSKDPQRGTFGDMFGSVNALFSGLAFAGVIFAILLQRKELALQRNELELTREELKGQKQEMALQNKTLQKQNFESTFFQLLRSQQEILNQIDLRNNNGQVTTTGRDSINVFCDRFRRLWIKNHSQLGGNTELERINNTYLNFYSSHQHEIGHYFRSLYHIVKLVHNSELENKRLYTNLLRAQLSSYELVLLFYNCLSDLGNEKFKPLIEEYSLLKNMPKNLLLNLSEHEGLYDEKAYG